LGALLNQIAHRKDLVCEFGCGHGHFLTAYATAHPDEFCLGIDILEDRIARAARKQDRAGLRSLHFIRAEANLFLSALPPEASIRRTFILFPDPWPKKRHHKHRIIQTSFLTLLRSRAHPGAELYFRSDHEPAFLSSQKLVDQHPNWKVVERPWPFEAETVFQQRASHYFSFCAEALP
jgi:tRNA (guanine-N7-)-methyltransferase